MVFSVHGNDYFAPLSSQKHNKSTDIKIKKANEQIAMVRCAYMLPINKKALKEIDFVQEMIKDHKYASILLSETQYLNMAENKSKLLEVALKTYDYNPKKTSIPTKSQIWSMDIARPTFSHKNPHHNIKFAIICPS